MSVRRDTAVVAALGVLLVSAAWAIWVQPQVVAGRQVSNWANLQVRIYAIDQYRKSHGAYPATLSLATPDDWSGPTVPSFLNDSYGHPLYYESDGANYLLASFGKDGVRDRRGYMMQPDANSVDDSPCRDLNIDTVRSSDGIRQLCGK